MKKSKRIVLVILSIILYVSLIPVKSFAVINDNEELYTIERSKIDNFVEEQMEKGKIPGVSIAIVKGDKIIYQNGYGYADIDANQKVTSKTLFELASNSKAFTGLAILKLQDEGLININDDIKKYIPWLKLNYKGEEAVVTIENLLHHTSGIPLKSIFKIPISNEADALETVVRTLIGEELDSAPGESYQYATINYDVLGLIIEKVTGTSYEKYMKDGIFMPLGLNSTYLFKEEANKYDISKGYKVSFLKPHIYEAPNYRGNKPAGYIISNAEDMGKWLKIQLGTDSNSALNKKLIEDSHIPNKRVAPDRDGSSYAIGWSVFQKGGGEIVHGGNNPNYSSYIVLRPEEKIGVVVLGNVSSPYISAIGYGIKEMMLGMDYTYNGKDSNQVIDKICTGIALAALLIIATTLWFIFKSIIEIINKKRKIVKVSIRSIVTVIASLLFLSGVTYCIHLIPYLLMGANWDFIFVWYPQSVRAALFLLYTCIWIVYFYFIITGFYKKKMVVQY